MLSWKVLSLGEVEVKTTKGVYTCSKLVLTAGAWIPELVPELQVVTYTSVIPEKDCKCFLLSAYTYQAEFPVKLSAGVFTGPGCSSGTKASHWLV